MSLEIEIKSKHDDVSTVDTGKVNIKEHGFYIIGDDFGIMGKWSFLFNLLKSLLLKVF